MKLKIASFGLASLLIASAAFGEGAAPDGAEVFRLNCMGCHGPQAAGTRLAPALGDVFTRLGEGQVREVLRSGRNLMPAMTHLRPEEVDAVLAFLQAPTKSDQTPSTTLTKPTPVLGKRLFQSNCATCHSTAVVPNPGPGPASMVNVTRRFSATEIENIMRNGVCFMPSFDNFSDVEAKSIIAFLHSLERDDAPISPGGSAGCAMAREAAKAPPGAEGAVAPRTCGKACQERLLPKPAAGCGGCAEGGGCAGKRQAPVQQAACGGRGKGACCVGKRQAPAEKAGCGGNGPKRKTWH